MNSPHIEFAYPVNWPVGRPRTVQRKSALLRHEGRVILFDQATRRLAEQVGLVMPEGKPWRMRELARSAHPDAGGSEAAMARLNAARDEGLKAREAA